MRTRLAAIAAATTLVLAPVAAHAVTNGVDDDGEHPHVGQLLFYVPAAVDPRFMDPGAWFTCTGTSGRGDVRRHSRTLYLGNRSGG